MWLLNSKSTDKSPWKLTEISLFLVLQPESLSNSNFLILWEEGVDGTLLAVWNVYWTPLFKFGFNPSLIDGILNVLPYELAS